MRRIFPFDSGAYFANKLPDYITTLGPDGYDLASHGTSSVDHLIDIFFGDDESYLHGKPRSSEEVKHRRKLGIRHSKIQALSMIYNRDSVAGDDRCLTIEIQSDSDIFLAQHLIGAVIPRPYFDDKELKRSLREINKDIIVANYDIWQITTEAYMVQIYEKTNSIYKKMGLISG